MATISHMNQEFPQQEDLFWSGGRLEVVAKVLQSGILASRRFQLDTFGEAQFASSSSNTIHAMTKETVTFEYGGQVSTTSHDEYERLMKGTKHKKLDQELYDVCFSRNAPYYQSGMFLVFPMRDLIPNHQCMDQDGFHLYDPDYKMGRPDAPGYHLDLRMQQPMIVVQKRDEAEARRILQSLAQAPAWEGQFPQGIGVWIEEHLIVTEELLNSTQANTLARERLFSGSDTPDESGFFLPTGQKGETAIRTHKPLYSYLTSEQAKAWQDKESKRFNTEELQNYLLQEKIEPDKLLTILMQDTELDDLYTFNSGVVENESVQSHTEKVLSKFETFFAASFKNPQVRAQFRLMLAMHDIGKGQAVIETQDTFRQHEFTLPVAERVFQDLGYTEITSNFLLAVIDQDFLGDFLKGAKTLEQILPALVSKAQTSGVSLPIYYEAIKQLYMCDASTYDRAPQGYRAVADLFEMRSESSVITFSQEKFPDAPFLGQSPAEKVAQLEERIEMSSRTSADLALELHAATTAALDSQLSTAEQMALLRKNAFLQRVNEELKRREG